MLTATEAGHRGTGLIMPRGWRCRAGASARAVSGLGGLQPLLDGGGPSCGGSMMGVGVGARSPQLLISRQFSCSQARLEDDQQENLGDAVYADPRAGQKNCRHRTKG